ncbi:MAG: SRPBCC family protein [Actinomycetota bacterium]|nr:SRPBCC family protein [Actinomycetota bacterium]
MRQVSVSVFISAPREQVYDFVADLAGRPAYTDHYLKDYRLARAKAQGKGAAARFLLETPLANERGEIEIKEADRPRRIVEEGRVGRLGRSRLVAVYEFVPEPGGTRVELTTLSDPATVVDRMKQAGVHRWTRRQTKTALERLRMIFEEPPEGELARVTVAGYDAAKSPRFGAPVGSNPSRPQSPSGR